MGHLVNARCCKYCSLFTKTTQIFSLLAIVLIYFSILLFYIFYIHGGPIQKVVLDKTGTRYARSATIINIIYALVLYYFKELNDLPMSTTWVFVGLLCGRELAISTMNKDYKFKYVFPLIGKDFVKMIFGLSVSVGIVLAIHYIIIPNWLTVCNFHFSLQLTRTVHPF